MGDNFPSESKKFNTGLTDFSVSHTIKTGPYADNLDVDAIVVGAGFGMMNQFGDNICMHC